MRQLMTKNSVFYIRTDVAAGDNNDEYKNDFIKVIKSRENTRIELLHQSPQINYRPCLVHFIKTLCKDKTLTQSTFHLSVYILDIFMDNHYIAPEQMMLVANVSLLLAAKLEENVSVVPRIVEFNEATGNRYVVKDYKNLEVVMWRFFHFDIMFPTAAHYTYYYMQAAITPSELKGNDKRNFRKLFYEIHENVTKYLDKIVDDVHLMHCYSPSKLAASIIAISRLIAGLAPWTSQLEELTEFSLEQLGTATLSIFRGSHYLCQETFNNIISSN